MKHMVSLSPMMLVILLIQAHRNDRLPDWHKTNYISELSAKRRTVLYSSLQASKVRVSEGIDFDTADELSVTVAAVPVSVVTVTQ